MEKCLVTAERCWSNIFCTKKDLAAVFLVGLDRLVRPIEAKFPRGFRQPIILVNQDPARVTLLELQKHLEPQIASWERTREAELVTAVAMNAALSPASMRHLPICRRESYVPWCLPGGAMRTCVNAFSVVGQTALLIQHALFAGISGSR